MKKSIIKLITLLSLFVLTSCSMSGELNKYQHEIFDVFDTVVTFTSYQKNVNDFNEYKKIVEDEFEHFNKLFDNYNAYEGINNIFTININAGKKPVKVDENILDILEFSKEIYRLTDGDVNFAFGSVLELWHNSREDFIKGKSDAKLPEEKILKEKSNHTNIDDVVINRQDKTVYIRDKNLRIDLGAIAKGYTVELIKKELKEKGLQNGIISAGGNVATIGKNPNSEDNLWKIAVQNPDKNAKDFAAILKVGETSIVTSGDYQRYFEYDGKKYHHIIDPKTLYPSDKFVSVTVILDDSAMADALSTAFFIKDKEATQKLISIEKPGVIWIDENYKLTKTEDVELVKK